MTDTTRDQRRAEFRAVFESIPGEKKDRIQRVCEILHYKPHTVQVLLCKRKPHKVIPEAKLAILKRELDRAAAAAA